MGLPPLAVYRLKEFHSIDFEHTCTVVKRCE